MATRNLHRNTIDPVRFWFPYATCFTADRFVFVLHGLFSPLSSRSFVGLARLSDYVDDSGPLNQRARLAKTRSNILHPTHLNLREVRWMRLSEKALGGYMVVAGIKAFDPSTAVDAPRLLPVINEFFDLIQSELIAGLACRNIKARHVRARPENSRFNGTPFHVSGKKSFRFVIVLSSPLIPPGKASSLCARFCRDARGGQSRFRANACAAPRHHNERTNIMATETPTPPAHNGRTKPYGHTCPARLATSKTVWRFALRPDALGRQM